MKRDKYFINAEIRDTNLKVIVGAEGKRVFGFKLESVNIESKDLEKHLTNTYKDLQVLMPNHKINVDASVLNGISGTYMVMASYYGEEKRFVKH